MQPRRWDFWSQETSIVAIRCAVADLDMKRRRIDAEGLYLRHDRHNHSRRGPCELRHETLDLRITPVPKDKSILVLRVPFNVKGNFGKPSVGPDKTLLTARIGGAILLGLINPVAALLPLIETGPGKDSPCARTAEPRKERAAEECRCEKKPMRAKGKPSAAKGDGGSAKK